MPELPEVETIRLQLKEKLIGKKIEEVEKLHPKTFGDDPRAILGAKIKDIRRQGKILIFDLDNQKSLVTHLKLTGQLIYEGKGERAAGGHPVPPLNAPVPNKTTRIIYHFEDGSKLYFNDLRLFAYIHVVPTVQVEEEKAIKEMGPEPFDEGFTKEWLTDQLSKKSSKIKALLLDQTFISGIGNIYSDEALYCAKIHPFVKSGSLAKDKIDKLYNCLKEVLKKGLKSGGASDNSYVNAKGEKGKFMDFASVYHKKFCPKGHPIFRLKMGGRSAHFCSVEQKL